MASKSSFLSLSYMRVDKKNCRKISQFTTDSSIQHTQFQKSDNITEPKYSPN